MPRLSADFKEEIKNLPLKDLQQIVLEMAAREKTVFDFVMAHYIDTETGEQELFEQTKQDIYALYRKSYRGFSQQLQLANMLSACVRRINEYLRILYATSSHIDKVSAMPKSI